MVTHVYCSAVDAGKEVVTLGGSAPLGQNVPLNLHYLQYKGENRLDFCLELIVGTRENYFIPSLSLSLTSV